MSGEIDHVGRLLKDASLAVTREVNSRMRENDVTSSQGWMLANLYFAPQGALTLKELEARSHTAQSSVWGVVDRLEKAGLVETSVHPADARARVVSITAAGRLCSERCQKTLDEVEDAIAAVMSPAERDELVRLLIRIASAF